MCVECVSGWLATSQPFYVVCDVMFAVRSWGHTVVFGVMYVLSWGHTVVFGVMYVVLSWGYTVVCGVIYAVDDGQSQTLLYVV